MSRWKKKLMGIMYLKRRLDTVYSVLSFFHYNGVK